MEPDVKQTAIRILTHSDTNNLILHKTLEAELGARYTEKDRKDLERLIEAAHRGLRDSIEALPD